MPSLCGRRYLNISLLKCKRELKMAKLGIELCCLFADVFVSVSSLLSIPLILHSLLTGYPFAIGTSGILCLCQKLRYKRH